MCIRDRDYGHRIIIDIARDRHLLPRLAKGHLGKPLVDICAHLDRRRFVFGDGDQLIRRCPRILAQLSRYPRPAARIAGAALDKPPLPVAHRLFRPVFRLLIIDLTHLTPSSSFIKSSPF